MVPAASDKVFWRMSDACWSKVAIVLWVAERNPSKACRACPTLCSAKSRMPNTPKSAIRRACSAPSCAKPRIPSDRFVLLAMKNLLSLCSPWFRIATIRPKSRVAGDTKKVRLAPNLFLANRKPRAGVPKYSFVPRFLSAAARGIDDYLSIISNSVRCPPAREPNSRRHLRNPHATFSPRLGRCRCDDRRYPALGRDREPDRGGCGGQSHDRSRRGGSRRGPGPDRAPARPTRIRR